jgi:exodeoxyribonuclease VII small subunit
MTDLPFEDALGRLEKIVDLLEGGSLSLEEALKLYEEGVGLARRCADYLGAAERKIEMLTRDEGGGLGTRPLAWDAGEEEP